MSGANKSVVPPAPSGGIVGKKATMKRLKGFDYRKPYFYMVTLKRLDGLLAFSQIIEEAEPPKDAKGRPCYLIANEITRAFASVIIGFAAKWRGLAPIDCFVIMPDHIHLLIRILDTGDSRSFTAVATRWAISPSRGWNNAGRQGAPHKTRVLCCPPSRATARSLPPYSSAIGTIGL